MTADDVITELENTFPQSSLVCHEQQPLSFEYRVKWAKWRIQQRAQEAADTAESERLAQLLAEAEQNKQ
jgi:hypothetical protein